MTDQLMILDDLEIQPDQPDLYYKTVELSPVDLEWLAAQQDRVIEAMGNSHGVVVDVLERVEARLGRRVMEEWSQRCFGWDAGLIAVIRTALPEARAQVKELQAMRDEVIRQRRAEGATQQQIADELGCDRKAVRLSEMAPGAIFDAPVQKGRPAALSAEDKAEILRRLGDGEKQHALAEEYGVSQSTIANVKKNAARTQTKALMKAPLPSAPSTGNDVSSSGELVTPPVSLFLEEGHELHKLAAYHHKRFVEEMKHCFAAIDNATKRLDKVHNAVLDDFQANHRSMFLRWTVYERIWKKEMLQDLECTDFSEIERRLEAKAKLLNKKVKHAFHDLRFDRSKITIAK